MNVSNPSHIPHASEELPPSRTTGALLGATLVGALGGLLFGFDTAVISGCQDQLRELFRLTPGEQGFMTASALIGAAVGSLAAAKPGDRYGRRDCLKIAAAFYLLCAVGCAAANGLWMMVTARILGGIAVGATSVLCPMYLAEISPAAWRGRLVACFQVNIVLGVLVAYLSNYIIGSMDLGAAEWRWKLGIQTLPALAFFVLLFYIPRSPRWLVMKGRHAEAGEVLTKIGVEDGPAQLASIRASVGRDQSGGSSPLFVRSLSRPIFLAVAVAMFNQLGGINALWYYADTIFAMAGFSKDSSALQSVILGVANLVSTLIGMAIIDKAGRKPLLLWGTVGCGIALALVAWIFSGTAHREWLVWLFGGFVVCHAFGQGAVIWVFISEIFPTASRSKGQTLGSFVHWFMAMLVSWTFPLVAKDVGVSGAGLPFAFFAAMMLLQLFVVGFLFPETKQVPLEDMDKNL
ncbi:sugar porter family MFS transporter [Luteolibacter yonseiensis]|uniref:Sugar porter family MFS transporter n=1 Tax=Luteolibacter yonseiensis TaxID=1144680 RepID=A0A934V7X3_9BACT|nr:sugar porter family MFS transporter [Luteolibacter yonseiensis]MBK1816622.1 sugar porter family MFS transporter [Luteolibacter yonseiensis]